MSKQPKIRQRRVHPTMGTQIRVCGVKVDKDADLVCMLPFKHTELPPNHPDVVHVALGLTVERDVVIVYRRGNGEPVWQGVRQVE